MSTLTEGKTKNKNKKVGCQSTTAAQCYPEVSTSIKKYFGRHMTLVGARLDYSIISL